MSPFGPAIPDVIEAVAAATRIDVDELTSHSRSKSVLGPRAVAYWLCRRLCAASYPEIARAFGGRDHTTVIHGVAKVEGDPVLLRRAEAMALVIEGLA